MKETFEEMSVSFVSDKGSSLILKPDDCSFDLPVFEISTKRSAVLTWWLFSPLAMWSDLFDTATWQRISYPVCISALVKDQWFWTPFRYTKIDKGFDGVNLGNLSRWPENRSPLQKVEARCP